MQERGQHLTARPLADPQHRGVRRVVGEEVVPAFVDAHWARGGEGVRLPGWLRGGRVVRAADQFGELLGTEPARQLQLGTSQRDSQRLHVLAQHGRGGGEATPVLADGAAARRRSRADADRGAVP